MLLTGEGQPPRAACSALCHPPLGHAAAWGEGKLCGCQLFKSITWHAHSRSNVLLASHKITWTKNGSLEVLPHVPTYPGMIAHEFDELRMLVHVARVDCHARELRRYPLQHTQHCRNIDLVVVVHVDICRRHHVAVELSEHATAYLHVT